MPFFHSILFAPYLNLFSESTTSLAALEDQLSIKYVLTSRNGATVNYCNLGKIEAIMNKVQYQLMAHMREREIEQNG